MAKFKVESAGGVKSLDGEKSWKSSRPLGEKRSPFIQKSEFLSSWDTIPLSFVFGSETIVLEIKGNKDEDSFSFSAPLIG